LQDFRPIYISGEEHNDAHTTRPRARNVSAIHNPTGFAGFTHQNDRINNVESNKIVAGMAYFPSSFALAFVFFILSRATSKLTIELQVKYRKILHSA
jgi:hypothetical protein